LKLFSFTFSATTPGLLSCVIPTLEVIFLNSFSAILSAANNTKGNGVLQEDVADGNYGSVKLWSAPGTHQVAISGSAVTAATAYGVITGGYMGVVTNTYLTSLTTAADADGTIVEAQVI